MRRRRSDNRLLVRMIGIGVLVTLLVLPILAYLGAFKAGKTGLMQMTMVNQALPKVPKRERAAKKPQHQKPHEVAHKAGGNTPQSTKALNVHVAAATTKGPPSDNTIVNGDSTKVGVVPTETKPPEVVASPRPPVSPPPVVAPPPVVKPPVAPPPVVEAPKPRPPHVAVISPAVPIAQPQPQLPDDMTADNLDETFGALLTIRTDGSVNVKTEKSTGNPTLDKLALDAARRWRFKPATRDGVPAQSYLHVEIEFQVS